MRSLASSRATIHQSVAPPSEANPCPTLPFLPSRIPSSRFGGFGFRGALSLTLFLTAVVTGGATYAVQYMHAYMLHAVFSVSVSVGSG